MPHGFTHTLATRLNDLSEMVVREAENLEVLKPAYVYIAPGDKHLLIDKDSEKYAFHLDVAPPVMGHRSSFDITLNSMAKAQISDIIGIVMTGMGRDGLKGLIEFNKECNIKIIAQDEKSCVVYGMPRVVTEMGIVDRIVPLQQIPEAILNYMGVQR